MKKYITPEASNVSIYSRDIIAASGEGDFMDFTKDGTSVDAAEYFS